MYKKDRSRKINGVAACSIAVAAILLGSNIYLFDKCNSLEQENKELVVTNNELQEKLVDADKVQKTLSNDKVELEQENKKLHATVDRQINELDQLMKQLAETTAELYMAKYPIPHEPDEVINQDVNCEPANITDVSGLTGDQFDTLIDMILDDRGLGESNPLHGKGYSFEYIEDEYGINGIYVLAIFTQESAFATRCCNTNNFGGIRGNRGWRYFNTPEDCVYFEGNLLKTKYVDCGLVELDDIGAKYCESGSWPDRIQTIVDEYCVMIQDI